MPTTLDQEMAALKRLTVPQLRVRYAELFGEPARTGHKTWLIKRLAWRLQALAEGDLSQRARQRAALLANDADLRLLPPGAFSRHIANAAEPPAPRAETLPPVGSVLTRLYKGQTLQVNVLKHGFEFEGHTFPSLSALAKKITGSHCSGRLFFRLGKHGVKP